MRQKLDQYTLDVVYRSLQCYLRICYNSTRSHTQALVSFSMWLGRKTQGEHATSVETMGDLKEIVKLVYENPISICVFIIHVWLDA